MLEHQTGHGEVVLDTAGKFSINLPTDVTTGESTTIGYRNTPKLKGLATHTPVELCAKASASTWDMADITPQTVVPLTATAVATTELDQRTADLVRRPGCSSQPPYLPPMPGCSRVARCPPRRSTSSRPSTTRGSSSTPTCTSRAAGERTPTARRGNTGC